MFELYRLVFHILKGQIVYMCIHIVYYIILLSLVCIINTPRLIGTSLLDDHLECSLCPSNNKVQRLLRIFRGTYYDTPIFTGNHT